MELRKLDRENLTRAHGLDSQVLLPWPALNAPFEGAWCVLHPGDASTPHAHHEYEIFIAITGRATVTGDGERRDFVAGDIVRLPPGVEHNVFNDNDQDFQFYAIWWDVDMSQRFLTQCEEASAMPDRTTVAMPAPTANNDLNVSPFTQPLEDAS
jgi:mannose-6-phosphate isomerase-like protein (cupin superfamily)